jgi:hypothetical protein
MGQTLHIGARSFDSSGWPDWVSAKRNKPQFGDPGDAKCGNQVLSGLQHRFETMRPFRSLFVKGFTTVVRNEVLAVRRWW